jgi:hypothetical protein
LYGLFACAVLLSAGLAAAELTPATAASFDRYARLTEQRINDEVSRSGGFLWIDTLPRDRQSEILRGVNAGAVIVERLQTRDGANEI